MTDDLPSRADDPLARLVTQDLAPLSTEELAARIGTLEGEIARVRGHMARVAAHRADADSLFRR